MSSISTPFTRQAGIEHPLICGAMFPCSNPELIAAVSEAGGIGIVQPLSFIHTYKLDLREALKTIRSKTAKPYGMNVLIEESSEIYMERMKKYVDIALEEGCRFFITALGNPRWVVEKVKPYGGVVYHDVIKREHALKAVAGGVDGLICVNNRAGGHAGTHDPQALYDSLKDLNLPMICAGGIGSEERFCEALDIGYAGVQMGTRFIATTECGSHVDYKNAIVKAKAEDIVLTERITGIPVSVIRTPYVDRVGLKVGPIARFLFRYKLTRNWLRTYYNLRSGLSLAKASTKPLSHSNYYQAGKSVEGIDKIEPAGDIVNRYVQAYEQHRNAKSQPPQS
jgi:nitronate monooxygenase